MPPMPEPRVYIPTMKETLRLQHSINVGPINQTAHDQLHQPRIIVFQTSATLDTTAGPGLRFPTGGEITRISGRVATAPSGDMSIDVLANAVTVFGGGYLKIPSGTRITKEKIVERPMFSEDTVWTVQINTINSAVGPLVLTFEYISEF